ncbi:DUF5959 family protein [Kitasatospora sp. NPDC015120]|uniref:DUF5959 family protein n=1 Tax=Kitasatospora sp. NPDC015120 TaxID=3364023 RepID=UPI0036F47544
MTLISEKGYAGASVEDIAEHADVARGTFFNHFPRKEALISAWVEARQERLMERLALAGLGRCGSERERPSPADGLRQCLAVLGALNEEEPELSRAMLTAWVQTGRPLEEEPYLGEILAELVAIGRARGEIATRLSSEQVGEALRDLYLGALYRWTRRAARSERPGRLSSELASALELVLHGLAVPERLAGDGRVEVLTKWRPPFGNRRPAEAEACRARPGVRGIGAVTAGQLDLALLCDDEGNGVRITVLGPLHGVAGGLSAEIVVDTPFVAGRLTLSLWRSRLTSWAEALDRLEAGEDVALLHVQRGPSVFIHLNGARHCPEVVVEDGLVSMTTVRVPIDLPADWVTTHRALLAAVLDGWDGHLSQT